MQRLLDRPETRALFAADPVRMGRLLRPLWRLFSVDPLPELLRLPPRPPRPRAPPRARPPRLSFRRGVPEAARLGHAITAAPPRPGSARENGD